MLKKIIPKISIILAVLLLCNCSAEEELIKENSVINTMSKGKYLNQTERMEAIKLLQENLAKKPRYRMFSKKNSIK
jgi:hypothetical protein